MSKALQTRIRRALVSLITSGSTHKIARMTTCSQGVGVAGLNLSRPKTTFDIVFTSHPDFLQGHEKRADVNMMIASPTLYLNDESDDAMSLIRRIEEMAGLPAEQWWSTHLANGVPDDEDDGYDKDDGEVWLEDWLSCLMDDSPAVDSWVRRALVEAIDDELLADIEYSIELKIDEIAEWRYAEA